MGIFGIFTTSSSTVNPRNDEEQQQLHQKQRSSSSSGLFCDEPIQSQLVVLTAPISLDNDDRSSSDDAHEKGTATRILDLFKGVGSDLTRFQVPVHFNMPKSQLQLYGESLYCFGGKRDLLSECAEPGTSPIDRFLAVVRWHISSTRPPPFGKAPYNPILGETHHVSVGDLNILLEQVSHHPPISALHATNEKKGIQLSFWQQPSPRFYGSGVEISINGSKTLNLEHFDEVYTLTSPKLGFRFLPVPGTEWTGNTIVECPKSGLKASLCFKGKAFFGLHGSSRRLQGKVWDSNTGQTLHEIHGHWDQIVYVKDQLTGTSNILYDAKPVLTNMRTPKVVNVNAISPMESVVVWNGVSEGIMHRDLDKARAAKMSIEEQQRALRKQRLASGSTWSPKFFQVASDGWEWHDAHQPVPSAPIIVEEVES